MNTLQHNEIQNNDVKLMPLSQAEYSFISSKNIICQLADSFDRYRQAKTL